MRPYMLLVMTASLPVLIECHTDPAPPDSFCERPDLRADQSPPALKCAAAKGLLGDNLLCVDFNSVSGLSDPKLAGWDFSALVGSGCTGWTIAGGKLQVNTANFPSYTGVCGFTMPAVSASDYAAYSSFTLSVVHTLEIREDNEQKAYIYMGVDARSRLLDQITGLQPRKQWVQTIERSAVPNGGTGTFQPLFKLDATFSAGGLARGWLIESIAINGIP